MNLLNENGEFVKNILGGNKMKKKETEQHRYIQFLETQWKESFSCEERDQNISCYVKKGISGTFLVLIISFLLFPLILLGFYLFEGSLYVSGILIFVLITLGILFPGVLISYFIIRLRGEDSWKLALFISFGSAILLFVITLFVVLI